MITQWTLWAGTLPRGMPVIDRVGVARSAGFDTTTASLSEVAAARDRGESLAALRSRARDSGVELSILDGLTGWLPSSAGRRPHKIGVGEAMRLVGAIDAASVTALAVATDLGPEMIAEHFASLCDRAAEHGCAVHLEFAPSSGVPDLASAWQIVQSADRGNGGLAFDTWHFFRSDPDFDLLATIPGDRILVVQVSDAAAEMVGKVIDDTTHRRRLPGDGAFDLERVIAALADIGALHSVGPEIFSDELHLLPPAEAAAIAGARVARVLVQVLGPNWRLGETT